MSDQALDLAGLRELADKATPGPWFVSPDALYHVRTVLENALVPLELKDGEPIADATLDADAALIAAARSAVPALLDEVERLTGERDRARDAAVALKQELALKDEALDQIRALAARITDEADDIKAEMERTKYEDYEGGIQWAKRNAALRLQRVLSSLASRLEDNDDE